MYFRKYGKKNDRVESADHKIMHCICSQLCYREVIILNYDSLASLTKPLIRCQICIYCISEKIFSTCIFNIGDMKTSVFFWNTPSKFANFYADFLCEFLWKLYAKCNLTFFRYSCRYVKHY